VFVDPFKEPENAKLMTHSLKTRYSYKSELASDVPNRNLKKSLYFNGLCFLMCVDEHVLPSIIGVSAAFA
jgi:hypothetical protein